MENTRDPQGALASTPHRGEIPTVSQGAELKGTELREQLSAARNLNIKIEMTDPWEDDIFTYMGGFL